MIVCHLYLRDKYFDNSLKRNTFSGVFVSIDKPNTLGFKIIVKHCHIEKLSQINPEIQSKVSPGKKIW